MLVWKKEFLTGIAAIDVQHRFLFAMIKEANEVLLEPASADLNERIQYMFLTLTDYAQFHFRTEEEYMAKIDYSNILEHKLEHESFIESINELIQNSKDQSPKDVLRNILSFLNHWFEHHIMETDMMLRVKASPRPDFSVDTNTTFE